MIRIKTHEELFMAYLKSVEGLIKDIKQRNKDLKGRKDYDELTQFHNTHKLIQRWFFMNGNLQI